MHIPEYTISPKLRDALQQAFEPFLEEQVDGVALPEWLKQSHATPLPLELRLRLGTTLDSLLALDGEPQDTKIHEAMDGILNNGGAPAILLHGLPTTAVTPIIYEAFRQALFADPAQGHIKHDHVLDKPDLSAPSGYRKNGKQYFHQDSSEITILAGVRKGVNPRYTAIADPREFTNYILSKLPASALGGMGSQILADQCFELLQLPIWPIDATIQPKGFMPARKNAELLAEEALKEGKLHQVRTSVRTLPAAKPISHPWKGRFLSLFNHGHDDKETHVKSSDQNRTPKGILGQPDVTCYAPIIYPNPDFHPDEHDSAAYRLFKAPWFYLYERMLPEMSLVPEHLRPAADLFVEALRCTRTQDVSLKQGPVLDAGDMLIFNNCLMVHAGGPHANDVLVEEPPVEISRELVAVDVHHPRHYTHPVRPGARIEKPIRMGMSGPEIDPSLDR